MRKVDIVRKAFDTKNPDRYSSLSDDFQWTDSMGSPPIGRDTWAAMGKIFESAIPDVSLVIDDIREEGDDVLVTSHFSGTFVNDLDLSAMGMGVIPATGRPINLPPQTDRVRVAGDRISGIRNLSTEPNSGMQGLLNVLGERAA